MFQSAPDRQPEIVDLVWLAQVVVGAFMDGSNRRVDAGESGHDDHGNIRPLRPDGPHQFHAVHSLHANVGDDQIAGPFLELLERFSRGRGPFGGVLLPAQNLDQSALSAVVVVNHENDRITHTFTRTESGGNVTRAAVPRPLAGAMLMVPR